MNNLEQLINDKYPDSEISHIERRAFEEGYRAKEQELTNKAADLDTLKAEYSPKWDHSDFHTVR